MIGRLSLWLIECFTSLNGWWRWEGRHKLQNLKGGCPNLFRVIQRKSSRQAKENHQVRSRWDSNHIRSEVTPIVGSLLLQYRCSTTLKGSFKVILNIFVSNLPHSVLTGEKQTLEVYTGVFLFYFVFRTFWSYWFTFREKPLVNTIVNYRS